MLRPFIIALIALIAIIAIIAIYGVYIIAIKAKPKEGHWECYFKYMEKNCFHYFLSIQCTNMGHLALVAYNDCQEVMAAM